MWKSMAILENNVSVSFWVTKLLLKLWGEPHKDKNHWEGVAPSPQELTQEREGTWGEESTKGTPADSGQRGCHRCWDLWALQEKTPRDGTGSTHRRGKRAGHGATAWVPSPSRLPFSASATWSLSPSACQWQQKACASALSLNPVTLLVHILLVGELYMATAVAQACLHSSLHSVWCCRPQFLMVTYTITIRPSSLTLRIGI